MKNIGLQLYTVRELFTDADGIGTTLKKIKECGYNGVQLYGSFDEMTKIGMTAKCMGMEILGSTGSFDEYEEKPEETIKLHKTLDAGEIGIGGYFYKNVKDIQEFIKRANDFADFASEHGFKFSYHNHSHEFTRYDNGKTAFEMLSEGLNENVYFVLDTYWVQHGGGDIIYWIQKLKNRINILHLKDMKMTSEGQRFAEVGCGNLNWEKIIKSALENGVNHFVVEQDECDGNPIDSIKKSSDYLHKNFVIGRNE